MNDRIAKLIAEAHAKDIFPEKVSISYDPFDEKLAEPMMIAKRLTEYMKAQPPGFGEENELVGMMHFDGSVPADIFTRTGHAKIHEAFAQYYNKPQENFSTMEWQHSNPDYGKVIRRGLAGIRADIIESRKNHLGDQEKLNFLAALDMMIRGIAERAELLAESCRNAARECTDEKRKKTLLRMAGNCSNVPMNPARNFEEAVQCVYFCFPFLPDSIGRADQYLLPLYRKGIQDGSLTREHAKELLQELYVMIHAWTPPTSGNASRSAESHFVVGVHSHRELDL